MTRKPNTVGLISTLDNKASDLLDKVSTPSSRAGITLERVAKMAKGNVSEAAIAAQLSHGSANGHVYTGKDVAAFRKLYQDNETKVTVTKKAAKALIDDAATHSPSNLGELPA